MSKITHDMTHYGHSMVPRILTKNARQMAKLLGNLIAQNDMQRLSLCYRGMSGISTATAIMCAMLSSREFRKYANRITMVYVRKPEEKSHGEAIEVSSPVEHHMAGCDIALHPVVFVDDFISSGETRNIVFHHVLRRAFPRRVEDRIQRFKEGAFYSLTMCNNTPTLRLCSKEPWIVESVTGTLTSNVG